MPGCRMPERPGTAAMSATLAVARDRARRRPGSGGSSPPHAVPQAEQLPLDTPIAPAWVLPRQLLHQRAHLGRDRWPARRVRVDPFLLDQAPVPCQQRSRSHDPVQAEVSGQQPRQGRQHGTVSPVRLRARDTCRRNTATSCRSTRISASLAASLRARSTSQPDTRTMKMYMRRMSTSAERRAAGQAHARDSGTAQANTKASAARHPRLCAWPPPIDSYRGEQTRALPSSPLGWPRGVQQSCGTTGNMTSIDRPPVCLAPGGP